MLTNVAHGDRIKLYLSGGADVTGDFQGFEDSRNCVARIIAPNGKLVRVRASAIEAVVEL